MDGGAGAGVVADPFRHRLHQPGGAPDPVGEGRPVEAHALAGVDVGLAVQGQMVAVLRDQHVGDQARARTAALDRQARHRRLRNRLAVAAAQLRPHVHHDLEVRGNIFQHLALLVADLAQAFGPARRADAGAGVGDDLARKMIGQRATIARARRTRRRPRRRRGRLLSRLVRSLGFLDLADRLFEPVDLLVEFLGRLAEAGAAQRRQLRLQLLDMQRLGVELRLQSRRERAQGVRVRRQFRSGERHVNL